ncbi:hypothetical protein [Arthrobacter sp. AZCC_0090]|uniref:hypothetical protein n=1 Tax=Arthrobacter sp. AZCC_0090 TaxID=2735881 RepID=UPI001612DE48|nr:hypothetical protein [Arthrobacter sp. AZCC_0090]MBB6405757.1 hypothetical protein [Arthrobacter sp. AZCC_0090]
MFISIPNARGARVLKGAAYREDSRDKERRLDDAVVLCATIRNPLVAASHMKGIDKSRILSLHKKLAAGEPAQARPTTTVTRAAAPRRRWT